MDLDPDRELVQPYILLGETGQRLHEPAYLRVGGVHYCFYEVDEFRDLTGEEIVKASIYLITSEDGIVWKPGNGGAPVLWADADWEDGEVGGPSVMHTGDGWRMWYAGGGGAGIGYAESDDGRQWTKYGENPVLVPDQDWENGVVGAPSVVRHDGDYELFYSGGTNGGPLLARRVGHAIGMATSSDGVTWTKHDGDGRSSTGDTTDVQPVFWASQTWEGIDAATQRGGAVSSPHVLIDHPVDRDVYRMYYSGNQPGDALATDVSIGYAGSYDGRHWTALEEGVNPIVQELFPLHLPGLAPYVVYGEWSPSVIEMDGKYCMIYAQTDPLDMQAGLAIAVNTGE